MAGHKILKQLNYSVQLSAGKPLNENKLQRNNPDLHTSKNHVDAHGDDMESCFLLIAELYDSLRFSSG